MRFATDSCRENALRTWLQNSMNGWKSRNVFYKHAYTSILDAEWRIWLRHCATSSEVAGSIPDSVNGIFH